MAKTYTIGVHPENGRDLLTLKRPLSEVPFYVWRDLGRLAGMSQETEDSVIFEFVQSGRLEEAERILRGAMWEKES